MSQMIKLPQQEMSVEALKALIAEAEAPQPVEGQVYRRSDTTDADPWNAIPKGPRHLVKLLNGQWLAQLIPHGPWEIGHCLNSSYVSGVQRGDLVPYTPPPPTFQVGQWVRPIDEADFSRWWNCKPLKVLPPDRDAGFKDAINPTLCTWTDGGWSETRKLRLATPEEIAAATRIVPKEGLVVRRHHFGDVLWFKRLVNDSQWEVVRLDKHSRYAELLDTRDLSTENYTILESYTVQGVQ